MSADNWSQCHNCIKIMKTRFENFKSEFYGKLKPEAFTDICNEFKRRIDYLESYNCNDLETNEDLNDKLDSDIDYKIPSIFNDCIRYSIDTALSLREDYEQGIDSDFKYYCRYSCGCENCGFSFSFKHEEDTKSKAL